MRNLGRRQWHLCREMVNSLCSPFSWSLQGHYQSMEIILNAYCPHVTWLQMRINTVHDSTFLCISIIFPVYMCTLVLHGSGSSQILALHQTHRRQSGPLIATATERPVWLPPRVHTQRQAQAQGRSGGSPPGAVQQIRASAPSQKLRGPKQK